MKKTLIRIRPVFLLALFLMTGTVCDALAYTPLPSSVYQWQLEKGTCTLWSASMMMRAKAYLSGCPDWESIDGYAIAPKAWVNGQGLNFNFTYSFSGHSISVGHTNYNGLTLQNVRELLARSPEGFTLYCGNIPHAVFVTDMVGDVVYCADPSRNEYYHGKRLPLSECTLASVYNGQQGILDNVTAIWYVTGATFASRDTTVPTIITKEIRNVTSTGYDIYVKASDNIGIMKMSFGTWHDNMSIDDAHWTDSELGLSEVQIHINTADFGGATDTVYHTNVYVFDYAFNHTDGHRVGDPQIGNVKKEKCWQTSVQTGIDTATIQGTLFIPYQSILGSLNTTDALENVRLRITAREESVSALTNSLLADFNPSVYKCSFDVPALRYEGAAHCYDFSQSNMSEVKNMLGQGLVLAPSTTYYYAWTCTHNGSAFTSDVQTFTTQAANVTLETPYVNTTNGNFCCWTRYDQSLVTLREAGIFLSTDANAVYAANTTSLPSNVECLKDVTDSFPYGASQGGTLVYYRRESFSSTSFQNGYTYYFKFYTIDRYGQATYSSVASYTIPGAVLYTLHLQYTEGGTASQSGSGFYTAGSTVTLTAAPATGYVFKEWMTSSGTLENAQNPVTSLTFAAEDATVTACFEAQTYGYTVTRLNDGGVYIGPFYFNQDGTNKKTFASGSSVELRAIPAEGYRFGCWTSDYGDIFENANAESTTFTMPAGDVNIYYFFEPVDYAVTVLSSEGGMAWADRQFIRFGETVTLGAQAYEGYTFDNWVSSDVSLTADGTSATFEMPSHDVTVTAQFRENYRFEYVSDETMWLPAALTDIEDEAFLNTAADYFVCSASTRRIGRNAFPEGSVVYVYGAYEMDIDPYAIVGNGYFVEYSEVFSITFAEMLQDTTNAYCCMDGAIPGFFSEWSEWSEWYAYDEENGLPTEESDLIEYEMGTQWREAPVSIIPQFTDWSGWSAWSFENESIPDASLKEEQTRTVYPFYYFECSNCGFHSPYWGRACTVCGQTVSQYSWHEGIWLPYTEAQCTVYDSNKVYVEVDGSRYFYWPNSPTSSLPQYRYKTRSVYNEQMIGDYGDWSDTEILQTQSNHVETRTVVRGRWRTYQYVD